MKIKYTISRKDLYNGDYENATKKVISGSKQDIVQLRTHLAVIYKITNLIKNERRKTL